MCLPSRSLAVAALLCALLTACTLPQRAPPPPEVVQEIAWRDGVAVAPTAPTAPAALAPLPLAADIVHVPPGPASVAPNAARREPPVDVQVDARPLARPTPRYPPALVEEGLDGRVVASFVVNSAGRVESVQIVQASHPLFEAAVREALKGWRFVPAQSGTGRAVPSRVRVPFSFRLED